MEPSVPQLGTNDSHATPKPNPDNQVLVHPPFYDPAAEIQRLRNARLLRNIMLFTKFFSAMRGATRRRLNATQSLESAAASAMFKDGPALLPSQLQCDPGDDGRDLHSELQDFIQSNRWPLVFKSRKVPSEKCHRLPAIPEDAIFPTPMVIPDGDTSSEDPIVTPRITSPTVKRRGGLTPLYALEEEEETEESENDEQEDGSEQPSSSDGEESRGSFEGEWGDVFILENPARLRKPTSTDYALRAELNLAKTEIASLQSNLSIAEHQLNHGRKREKRALTALARQKRLNNDLKSQCSELKCKFEDVQRAMVCESCGGRMSKPPFNTLLQTPPTSPDYTPPSPLCPLPDDYDDIQPVHPAEFDGQVLVVHIPEQDAEDSAWREAMTSGRVSRLGLV